MRLLVCLLICPAAFAATSFNCPTSERTGYFADPDQCDKYWDCNNGVAVELYCDDGLAFSERSRRTSNPCVYHWMADCEGKTLQAPNGTAPCTRQNGYFPSTDENNCIDYYLCVDNKAELTQCAPGLIYNIQSYTCDWPEQANRLSCSVKSSVNGFTCPGDIFRNRNGLREQHPRFIDPDNCRSFYTCLNGVTPRQNKCPLGEVFSDAQKTCTLAEFVPGCEDFYENHPLKDKFTDEDGDGRVDVDLEAAFRF